MDRATDERVRSLQSRIDRALQQPLEEAGASRFSEYLPGASIAYEEELRGASGNSGVTDVEAILDRFDRLLASADRDALRHALAVVLTHHPMVAELGVRLPSLADRSPWKAWPSRREP